MDNGRITPEEIQNRDEDILDCWKKMHRMKGMCNGLLTPEETCVRFLDFLKKQRTELIVKNINLLLSLLDGSTDCSARKAAELKIVLERFGIQDNCHIMVTDDYKLRVFYTGYEEEENE